MSLTEGDSVRGLPTHTSEPQAEPKAPTGSWLELVSMKWKLSISICWAFCVGNNDFQFLNWRNYADIIVVTPKKSFYNDKNILGGNME